MSAPITTLEECSAATLMDRLRVSGRFQPESRGLGRAPSRSSICSTPDSKLSYVSSKAPTALSVTPAGPQSSQFRHYCPICMKYFKEIYVTSCCKHSVCKPCAVGYIEAPQEPSAPFVKDCLFCKVPSMKLIEITSVDNTQTRNYETSPAVSKNDSFGETPPRQSWNLIQNLKNGATAGDTSVQHSGATNVSVIPAADAEGTLLPPSNFPSEDAGPTGRKNRRVRPFPSLGPPDAEVSDRHLQWTVPPQFLTQDESPDKSAPTA